MYLKRVEYLKSLYPAEDLMSAIITIASNNTPVGTPCIVNIKPFPTDKPRTGRRGFDLSGSSDLLIRVSQDGSRGSPKKAPPAKAPKKDLMYAKDLYEMDISKANELISSNVSKTNALFTFSTRNDYIDFHTKSVYGHQIYFNGLKPLILDDSKRFEPSRLSDIHNKSGLDNFAEMVYNLLRDNRYVNYTFTDVMESNKKYMMEDINLIFNSLKKTYPYHVSCFRSVSEGIRSLVDVISISFYRLSDIIAIFDFNNTIGIGVEIVMTNSLHDKKLSHKGDRSVTYRFLFSSSRENLFTIDGETLARPSDCPTDKIINKVHKIISEEVPYDKALKSKKQR